MKKLVRISVLLGILILIVAGLSACKGGDKYSVICENAEHGRVTVAADGVKAGEKVILAAHPDAGYKLVSFVLDGKTVDGCSFVMPKRSVTVSATFEAITYSVTYVSDGATVTGNNPDTYTVENVPELIAPQTDGYEICGWYRYCVESEYGFDIEDYRVTSLAGIYGDVTLYARYYNPPHEICFEDGDNGRCYIEDFDYDACYGKTYNVTVDPDNGYYLDSLYLNGEPISGTSFTMPACDATITSVFKPIEIEINYVLFGGTNSENNPATITVEDGYVQLEAAYKEGYIFLGWCTDEELTEFAYDIYAYDYLERPLTLYACFEEDAEDYFEVCAENSLT